MNSTLEITEWGHAFKRIINGVI